MTMPVPAPLPRRAAALALAGLLAAALSACGFQLRGSYQVPDFLTAVSLKLPSGSRPLATELRLALERKHIQASGGDIELEVMREHLTRQASTVDSRARVAEYILVYTVDFRVNSSDGRATGPRETLILRRGYQYSTENVVGKNTEEETLLGELRADAAQQIVRQLATLKAPPGQVGPVVPGPARPAAEPAAP